MISIFDMDLLGHIKDIKVRFSQNILYLMKEDFIKKPANDKKKDFSWVFTEREGHICYVFVCMYIYSILY